MRKTSLNGAAWARAGFPRPLAKEDSALTLARKIANSSPDKLMHGPVRTLKDMTPAEIRAIEKRYGCKVKPR